MNLTLRDLLSEASQSIEVELGKVRVLNEAVLRERGIDALIQAAVFGSTERQTHARWLIWETAQALNIRPASLHELYVARGNDRVPAGFSVPALNIRAMAYDSARAAFRAAIKSRTAALMFELARSEMVYTSQRPAEHACAILAAAVKEGFHGLVFLQGDHFQVDAGRYLKNTDQELGALKHLIDESLHAGFYNFDLDATTLVDAARTQPDEQQRLSSELCALLSDYIRTHHPHGVIPAIGGEAGGPGPRNTDIGTLRAFLDGYRQRIRHHPGLSKVTVRAGTARGGAVLPDGSPAPLAVDLDLLRALSALARKEYSLGGVVQHGASTLPDEALGRLPQSGALEVHLATGFQNLVFDLLPPRASRDIRAWVFERLAAERKAGDTDEQFFYKARKLALGPFKQALWSLPDDARAQVRMGLEQRFAAIYKLLNVEHTRDMVATFVSQPEIHKSPQDFAPPSHAIQAEKEEITETP